VTGHLHTWAPRPLGGWTCTQCPAGAATVDMPSPTPSPVSTIPFQSRPEPVEYGQLDLLAELQSLEAS
jgi:hypothetical protein